MMKETQRLAVLCFLAGMTLATSSLAQRMYRCGASYQDKPCDGEQVSKEVRNFNPTPSFATAATGADAQCRQRGIDSQKVVWAREAGATAQRQMADLAAKRLSGAKAADQRRLIEDVYAKRGSAPEVRAAIEAECVAAKQRAEQAAALMEAARSLQGERSSSADAAPAPLPDDQHSRESTTPTNEVADRDGALRQAHECNKLAEQRERLDSDKRTGGSAATMERLMQRGRDLEARRALAPCR